MPSPRGRWKTARRPGMPWHVRRNDDRPAQYTSAPTPFGLSVLLRRVDRSACLVGPGPILLHVLRPSWSDALPAPALSVSMPQNPRCRVEPPTGESSGRSSRPRTKSCKTFPMSWRPGHPPTWRRECAKAVLQASPSSASEAIPPLERRKTFRQADGMDFSKRSLSGIFMPSKCRTYL